MKYEVLDKVAALMTAAFGLVAALAWNDAIKSLFAEGGPLYFMAAYGIWGYAILVTIIAVFATIWIGKMAEEAKKKEKAKGA
ncbi:DUF5654 family protein [Methanotrichaceae archaeon M04Ac]|uniref:DUF5654 family protein n=1 Tax=Candidatus Methanocrinis alkalitolerans TaxID=3033395 RepID=A0ABT5XFN5_9EURY|nr:DUF5654 family protein [Candidatus Methanocrinis alkalitolerans]MCR3883226.1 DUF5654 family protein [Methanothrix sp.]MDF0593523.1 DUF5654 family protein [Candidatus Methanocrinis alkalitolerans]